MVKSVVFVVCFKFTADWFNINDLEKKRGPKVMKRTTVSINPVTSFNLVIKIEWVHDKHYTS